MMKIVKVNDYEELSDQAFAYLVDNIKEKDEPVVGLATGSTPEGMYQRLIQKYQNKEMSFKNVTTFNLDEYVGLHKTNEQSYYYYMYDKLFNHIDIKSENIYLPNGMATDLEQECTNFEKVLKEKGPIHVQVLGMGVNGHIGFNEPGTPFTSRTQIVQLGESTRKSNSRFFNSVDEVPTRAITMGIGTIMESEKVVLLVSGENKADALARLVDGEVAEDAPASILQHHADATIIADAAALSKVQTAY